MTILPRERARIAVLVSITGQFLGYQVDPNSGVKVAEVLVRGNRGHEVARVMVNKTNGTKPLSEVTVPADVFVSKTGRLAIKADTV